MEPVVTLKNIKKSFGRRCVLDGLSMDVPEGSVYAFLGRNGSGKTTTIKLLLGLVRPDGGDVSVLGSDPARTPERVKESIGFVSENRPFYGWMSIAETLSFVASFHPAWDWEVARELTSKLGLKPGDKVHALSRGMLGKLALVTALGHQPRLLVLDEPTSGLDAVVRKEFIEQAIELVAGEGRTVLFSSHLIDEVERIADRVGILHEGRLIVEGAIDDVKESFVRVRALFDHDFDDRALPLSVLDVQRLGRELTLVVQGLSDSVVEELRRAGARRVDVAALTLEEIFVARTAGGGGLA